jgi:hypothetical protein
MCLADVPSRGRLPRGERDARGRQLTANAIANDGSGRQAEKNALDAARIALRLGGELA